MVSSLGSTNQAQAYSLLTGNNYDWAHPAYDWGKSGSTSGNYDWSNPPTTKPAPGASYDWSNPPSLGDYDWSNPPAAKPSPGGSYDWSNPPSPDEPGQSNPPASPSTPVPPTTSPPASSEPLPQTIAGDEQWMIARVNQERTSQGLKPLQVNPALTELARKKSQDIIINNYFAHESPTYGSPSAMVRAAGISYRLCGENLAKAGSIEVAHQILMESSAHRANILNQNYTDIGIGVARQKSGGVVVTQLFIAD